jgi:hypothetical protein
VSTVTVDFVEEGERTTVVLEHSDLESPDSRDRHASGWEGCLEMLQTRIFDTAPRPS